MSADDDRVSVMSVALKGTRCQQCGAGDLTFHVHAFAEDTRPVLDLCKSCTVLRAGGEQHVWVKTTWRGLRETWTQERKREAPPSLETARAVRRERRTSASGPEADRLTGRAAKTGYRAEVED